MSVAVAISTTGQDHRLGFLKTSVAAWSAVLKPEDSLFVTVDGSALDVVKAAEAVSAFTASVFQVGASVVDPTRQRRMGVAVNKNTGIELMMGNTDAEHLFLCDDDTWPRIPQALDKHITLAEHGILHSIVAWGKHRRPQRRADPDEFQWAEWDWPRGVLLYSHREAIKIVGGMDERFGPGGHEHVEWSRRFHNALQTPGDFCTPLVYAERGPLGPAMRASILWHCEDMPRLGEPLGNHRLRRRKLTTIERNPQTWEAIEQIMAEREGSSDYVPFGAVENGRLPATMWEDLPRATRAEEPGNEGNTL